MFTFVTKTYKEDVEAFNKHNFEKNYKNLATILLVGALLTATIGIILIVTKNVLWLAIVSLVLSLLSLGAMSYFLYMHQKGKFIEEDVNNIASVETVFDKKEIRQTVQYASKGSATVTKEYSQIKKVEENKKYYFLYVSRFSALILRKDSLTTGEERSDFRKFLRKEKNFNIIDKSEREFTKNRERRRQEEFRSK